MRASTTGASTSDDVRGDGPEIISVEEPVDGAHQAIVHYCGDRIGEPTIATLAV